MGQSSLDSPYRFIMKMFVVLALAAVAFAEPEADPQVVVSGSPVSTVYNTPFTYSAVNAVSSPLLRAFTPYSTFNGLYNTGLYNGLYSGVYGSRLVHTIAKRDADADPAVVYTSCLPLTTYGAVSHVAPVTSYSTVGHVAPVTSYSAVSPVATYTAVNNVVKPVSTYAAVPATHSVTSYNNPSHYTAVTNGVFGPKYIAKNHGVEHVVKRSAEPFVYSTFGHYPVAGHVVKGAYALMLLLPLPLDTPTPPMLESAPTTWESRSHAKQSADIRKHRLPTVHHHQNSRISCMFGNQGGLNPFLSLHEFFKKKILIKQKKKKKKKKKKS